jgi:O-antigen ligase
VFAAAVAGAMLVRDPHKGIAVLGACVFLPLVLLELPLAFAAWVPIAWNEFSHVFGKAPLGGTLLLLAGWIGARRVAPRGAAVVSGPSVRFARIALGLLLVWVALSISWATDRGDAWFQVRQWLLAAAVFVLVIAIASTPARLRLIALAFIAGALASIVIGLTGAGLSTTATALDLATRERFSGGAGDPNYLAAGLVAAIALAAGLMASYRDPLAKLGLGAVVLALAAAMAETGSRGGLIAAAFAVVAALVFARERRAATAAFAAFAVSAVTIFLLLSPAAWTRMTEVDAAGTGRTQLWEIALRMAGDHPLAGVGVGGFEHDSKDYVLRPGNLTEVANIAEHPAVTHNVYLQQLAETGAIGVLALLAVFLACLAASQVAAGRFRARGDLAMAALSSSVGVAIVGMLAASAFISNATDKRLWIVLALGPALLVTASSPQPASTER